MHNGKEEAHETALSEPHDESERHAPVARSSPSKQANEEQKKKEKRLKALQTNPNEIKVREVPQDPSNMFLNVNTALGPPYRILLDTNFLNFSIMNKLDIFKNSMDCLFGKCKARIT